MTLASPTSPTQVFTRASRAGEVLAVLRRHGLIPFPHAAEDAVGPRLRDALIELGAPAVKLGQFLAQRPDLIGAEVATELESLHADVPPEPELVAFATFEEELGIHPRDYFLEIDGAPIAAGSVGQVHLAVLPNGRRVAVKIRRHDIVERCAQDLDVLHDVAKITEFSRALPQFDVVEAIARFRALLDRELDMRIEAAAIHRFNEIYRDDPRMSLPEVIDDASGQSVLTMTWLDGIPFTDPASVRAQAGDDIQHVVETGVTIFLDMIVDGTYHADPHPGNLMLTPDGRIGIVDFGAVGWLHPGRRTALMSAVRAFNHNDSVTMTQALLQITRGAPPDRPALIEHVRTLMQRHRTADMQDIDVEELLQDLIDLLNSHERILGGDMASLFRCVVTLDGTARALEPAYDLSAAIDRWSDARKQEAFGPAQPLIDALPNWPAAALGVGAIHELAEAANQSLEQLHRGELTVQVRPVGLDSAVHHLTTATMVAALVVSGAVLMATDVPPTVGGVSVFGALAFLTGLGIGMTTFLSMLWHHLRR